MQGGRREIRHCPGSLDTIRRSAPMSAGDVTRTVAPGMAPPLASLTVPASVPVSPCALVRTGRNANAANAMTARRGNTSTGTSLVDGQHTLARQPALWSLYGDVMNGQTAVGRPRPASVRILLRTLVTR